MTEREKALAELIGTSLTTFFEQRLTMVEARNQAFLQQQTEVVANLLREARAQTVPEAVAAAGRTAEQILREQQESLNQVRQEASGAVAAAQRAAGEAIRAAEQARVPAPQPAPEVLMGGIPVPPPPIHPVGLDGFLLQSILPGLPYFAGDDPLKEGMTADHLINHVEAIQYMHPSITEGQMITATTSRFKKGSYAFNWWQNAIAGRMGNTFPFPTWYAFKTAFSLAMRGPDQATAVRRQITSLRMKEDELGTFVGQFRSLFLRLRTLNSPMAEPDAVYLFARGLSPQLQVH